jgi:hypothetical protein
MSRRLRPWVVVVVGAPSQRGNGAIDLHLGMIIPRGNLGHLVDQAPLRGQGEMAAQRRLLDKDQLPLLRPLFHQCLQLSPKGRLFLGLGFQVAMPQPPQSKPQRMQQLSHPLPAIIEAKPRVDKVPHQFGGPQTGVIARIPRTTADSLFDLRPLIRRESRGSPWDRGSLQPWQASFVDRMHPATNGFLIAVQPLGNLRAALPIKQQQHAGVPLPQPHIVRPAKGAPYLLPGNRRIRDFQHVQALPLHILVHVYQQGLKNRNYFVGLL